MYRVPPFSTAEWEEKKALFDEKTGKVWRNAELSARAKLERICREQFWLSFVEDKFDLDNDIRMKAEFSHVIAVMDKNRRMGRKGRRTRELGGPKIRCEHVDLHKRCCVQRSKPHTKLQDLQIEIYYGLCDDALDEHVWVSEQTTSLQEAKVLEALQYDFEIPCIVQWEMLWFSAPTSLNNDLLNDGEILGNYYEAVNLAFQNVLGARILLLEGNEESSGRHAWKNLDP